MSSVGKVRGARGPHDGQHGLLSQRAAAEREMAKDAGRADVAAIHEEVRQTVRSLVVVSTQAACGEPGT